MNRKPVPVLVAAALLAASLAVPAPSPAEAGREKPPRVIRVQGEHRAEAAPDRARLAVSVVSRAPTASQAASDNAKASAAVLGHLRKVVPRPGEVETGGYSVAAEYDYRNRSGGDEPPKPVGYVATNRLSVVTADLAGLGRLIDESVGAGANRIDSVSFFLDDDEEIRRQALVEAGRAARREAEAVAEGLGVGLGEVIDAATVQAPAPPVAYGRMARTAEASVAASTEIVPGSLEVHASVTVTFAIR